MDDDVGGVGVQVSPEEKKQERLQKKFARLWRVWRTCHEMVRDRGYELSDAEINIPLEDFMARFSIAGDSSDEPTLINRRAMTFSARPSEELIRRSTPLATPSNPDPKPNCGTILVEFIEGVDITVGTTEVTRFSQTVGNGNYHVGIMVTNRPLTKQAAKALSAVQTEFSIECFVDDDLVVNIMKHELVPRHVLLSTEEKVALLKRYRLKETQLPRILQKDPVSRYLGLKRGQVVKIIRTSETAGRYASYRLCV